MSSSPGKILISQDLLRKIKNTLHQAALELPDADDWTNNTASACREACDELDALKPTTDTYRSGVEASIVACRAVQASYDQKYGPGPLESSSAISDCIGKLNILLSNGQPN